MFNIDPQAYIKAAINQPIVPQPNMPARQPIPEVSPDLNQQIDHIAPKPSKAPRFPVDQPVNPPSVTPEINKINQTELDNSNQGSSSLKDLNKPVASIEAPSDIDIPKASIEGAATANDKPQVKSWSDKVQDRLRSEGTSYMNNKVSGATSLDNTQEPSTSPDKTPPSNKLPHMQGPKADKPDFNLPKDNRPNPKPLNITNINPEVPKIKMPKFK